MDQDTVSLVEEFLEPVCLTFLAMNQRQFVDPLIRIIGIVKEDPYYAIHHSLMNNIRMLSENTDDAITNDIEILENLPYNEKYDPAHYRQLAEFRRHVLDQG